MKQLGGCGGDRMDRDVAAGLRDVKEEEKKREKRLVCVCVCVCVCRLLMGGRRDRGAAW